MFRTVTPNASRPARQRSCFVDLLAERFQELALLVAERGGPFGEHPLEDLLRPHRRHRFRRLHCGLDRRSIFGLDLSLPGLVPSASPSEVPADPVDGVALAPIGLLL